MADYTDALGWDDEAVASDKEMWYNLYCFS